VCDPLTEKEPLEPETVPGVVVPSPQSIVATKSVAGVAGSLSLKVATKLFYGTPRIG
jgi:hypothetical protein